MKKIFPLLCLLILFSSCKDKSKENVTAAAPAQNQSEKKEKVSMIGLASYKEIQDFFEPSFEAITPEKTSAQKEKTAEEGKTSQVKSDSVIPGLRKLTDYKTKYQTGKADFYKAGKIDTELEEKEEGDLFVESWGPQMIVSESDNPQFYVIFSQPVHRVQALEAPETSSDIMQISPALKGVFRWYGSKHLAFESEEKADPSVEYTITISDSLKSLSKNKITGERTFTTKAEEIKIERLYGGYIKDSDCYSNWTTGTVPPYDKRFYVRLNYAITLERFYELCDVIINDTNFKYTAELDYNKKAFPWGTPLIYNQDEKKSNSFVVNIQDKVPFGCNIIVRIKKSNSQDNYPGLKPFYIREVKQYTSYSENKKSNPLEVIFSQKPDLDSIITNTSFDFDYKLTKDNVSIEGTTVKFFNLPIEKREEHTITFAPGLKDAYGQQADFFVRKYNSKTNEEKRSYNFTVSSPVAYSRFLNYGDKIMEAQFPHKILFEYQNINPGSVYYLEKGKYPLKDYDLAELFADAHPIDPGKKDLRHFTELDLNPYLTNGYGTVRFQAEIEREHYNSWSDKIETIKDRNTQTIQVTDIGVTARVGINKAVIFATSMQTGKGLADADVEIFEQLSYKRGDYSSKPFASGKTDKNGLCVIKFTEEEYNTFTKSFPNLWKNTPVIRVSKGDDQVMFQADSHTTYGHSVWSTSYEYTAKPKRRLFMFVDRMLYRPGETVTFRGIDRDQNLGMIRTHLGDYNLSVTKRWETDKVVPDMEGALSSSGGFYGSFKLPDNIEPGVYTINYRRKGSLDKYDYDSVVFNVAEFERLKIESNVTIPEITYYGGDKITAAVSADYLAGGSLANADYDVSWYKQPVHFSPETVETKGYTFGPDMNYSSRTLVQQAKGSLNSSGKANVFCNSEKITDGSAYSYRVQAAVTDVSNQRGAAQNAVTLHPAEFYAGLKRLGAGFAKKGQKVDFSYILVEPDGKLLSNLDKAKELNYVLTRSEWSLVHEQSVDDTVYTRYERKEVEEDKGSLKLSASGVLSLTPKQAGWFTLKVSGKDRNGNYLETTTGFYACGSDAAWRGSENSESIELTPSQSQYNPGDKAELLMESPLPAGDYLITVEREGIFTQEVRHFDESANVIEIPISENYVPVVYVSVASFSVRHGEPSHQYGEPDLDKPKGYYGVTSLFVNPLVKAFSIQIECDKPVYRPGEEVTVTLTATKGNQPFENAELTLMAVDRGVLDLVNYHVPNPIDFFYDPENFPLGVHGGDSRSLLMDPVTYSIKDLAGGDSESEDEEKEDERKDFRPTAVFEPVIITDKDGKAKVTFTMPDNLTTYRITAFGVKDDLFALSEDEVKVQNPINIQVVKPGKLRERDTCEFGVLITNLDKDTQKINVKASVKPLTDEMAKETGYLIDDGMSIIPGEAFIDGASEHSVNIASRDSSVVYFDLAAVKKGAIQFTFEINSSILKEKVIQTLDIQKPYIYETTATMGILKEDEKSQKESFVIPSFTDSNLKGEGELEFTLDATRLGPLGSGVSYLFEYPYGCLEQQSSKILPLIIFQDYIDMFDLKREVINPSHVIKSHIVKWAKYQNSDGGFPYWPEGRWSQSSSLYVSARIAHVYATALKRGFNESSLKINSKALINYISTEIKTKTVSKYQKAYCCYVLSLFDDESAKKAALTSLNDFEAGLDKETLTNLCYLGLAYYNIGDRAKAEKLQKMTADFIQAGTRDVSVIAKNKRDIWDFFESETEQYAVLLQLYVSLNPDNLFVDKLVYTLLENQTKGYWQNTATTAHVLEAIYTYIKMMNLDDTKYTGKVNLNSKEILSAEFDGPASKPKSIKLDFNGEELKNIEANKAIPVEFTKDGQGRLFYTMSMKYALPEEMLPKRDEGLKISYEIVDTESGKVINTDSDTSLLSLESGKLYKATIKIESTKNRSYVALRAPLPSGAEILNSTFVTSGIEAESSYSYSYRHSLSNKVIYDNEIQFFWDDFGTGSTSVDFTFRAARRGVFPTPPVTAECMYEPEVFGRSDGYLFTIK